MTNDRIQKWLASFGGTNGTNARAFPTAMEREADAIIRCMAGPDGALQIADEAACELILSECRSWEDGGVTYWEVEPMQLVMTLDQEEIDIARAVSRAVRYLVTRGLLAAHPTNQRLVRPLVALRDA